MPHVSLVVIQTEGLRCLIANIVFMASPGMRALLHNANGYLYILINQLQTNRNDIK